MLPLSQSTLIESRCKFVLPSESITNRPPNLFMLAKKKTTLELQYAVRVFFFLLYGNGVKYTLQTRWADITCSVRHTSCVLCCPSAVRVRSFCPCIMCQNSIHCVWLQGCHPERFLHVACSWWFAAKPSTECTEFFLKSTFQKKHVAQTSWDYQTLKAFLTHLQDKLLTIIILTMHCEYWHIYYMHRQLL